MPDSPTKTDPALLTAALDHAWSRFNFRISSALQILNYYLVAVAILSAAYVGALTQGLEIIGALIAVAGSTVSLAALLGGYGQILYARNIIPQLRELEQRLAAAVEVPDIWANSTMERRSRVPRLRPGTIAAVMFIAAFFTGIGAAIYAFIGS